MKQNLKASIFNVMDVTKIYYKIGNELYLADKINVNYAGIN